MIEAIADNVHPVSVQNLLFYRIPALEVYPDLNHAIFTRQGGVSARPYHTLNFSVSTGDDPEIVKQNLQRACQAIDITPEQTASCHQIHSANVFVVDKANQQQVVGQGDALITRYPDIYLLMRFADCTPLLFYDPNRGAVGATHAGWRGTMQNVAGATVTAMVNEFGCHPRDITAVIGPAIGPCCYEVGTEVIEAAREAFGDVSGLFAPSNGNGHAYFDMWETNRRQLAAAGVEKIIQTRLCTACHTDKFFSHRAEKGRTGRLGTLIGMRGSQA